MLFLIFSPDGKNFCQFMAPDFPKPMFLAQIQPGLVGALAFYISQTDIWALGALWAHLVRPLGPLRAHLVGPLGPFGPS